MASFTHFFLIFLIFSAVSLVHHAEAQKRCQEQLYPKGCTLNDCGKKCFDKHKQMSGVCIQNRSMTDYACYCIWNC
ncbi:putative defensin-like protein 165 [Ricinus communis]|uniref:putative defensin-like protein 165 n=1 Tax=Ricinus communis TaxID=3988 RepID=UPI00201A9B35|nr:putative defensin-like protein 165 [Ricinus communis]